MSDTWIAIIVGAAVPVVVLLGPYAWMLLPWYWEPNVSPEKAAQIRQQMVDDYFAGLAAGINAGKEGK